MDKVMVFRLLFLHIERWLSMGDHGGAKPPLKCCMSAKFKSFLR